METLNLILLTLHNITRWALLILALLVIVRAFRGWFSKTAYQDQDRKFTVMYSGIFDLQILLGIILFFTKGWGNALMSGDSSVMSTAAVRFFAVEHWTIMLLAAILVHVGSAQVKKAAEDVKKYRRAAIWFTISLLMVLAAIPWPGMESARPLLRLFGLTF
ncbi:MAG: hypothetical protein CVU39_26225 [Chloroflexi bacterium HGW-Chloroflexi-10]|nr:MAG: hypothetical protein CVU39_26225 [Chloroflexi bacterium HGW-Chloroflexi-10]